MTFFSWPPPKPSDHSTTENTYMNVDYVEAGFNIDTSRTSDFGSRLSEEYGFSEYYYCDRGIAKEKLE